MSTTSLNLSGDPDYLKISATDVASSGSCPRYLAVKIRPEVSSPDWRRSYGNRDTFVLGVVAKIVLAAHFSPKANDPTRLTAWIRNELEQRRVLPLLRPYATAAVTNVLEAHWDIEDEIGPLRLLQNDPAIGQRPRILGVWGPLYSTEDGVREIRRYRLGSARTEPHADDLLWTQTSARIAAAFPSPLEATRVRIVEIGAGDGSMAVAFDDTPAVATSTFNAQARDVAGRLGDLAVAVPGFECSTCKVAGVCDTLIHVDGVMGQEEKGYATRSIAPSDLDRYAQCPAQWLLASELHLPRDAHYTDAQTRGLLVHQWLEVAHKRGVGCSASDLPDPGDGLGLAADFMSTDEYSLAHPFLRHHVEACPLSTDGVELVAAEELVHGFDAPADVVTVTKPDMLFRVGDRLVIREFKTSTKLPSQGADEIYDQYLQVPFLISMLAAGIQESYGSSAATVEVEVLTPEAGEVFAWDLEDDGLIQSAGEAVKAASTGWHTDSEWKTNPGHHCTWCPVRQWCPDGHTFQSNRGETVVPAAVFDDDPPPF